MTAENERTATLTLRFPQPCGCMAELSVGADLVESECGCYGIVPPAMADLLGRLAGQLMKDYTARIVGVVPWPCASGRHDWKVCPADNGGQRALLPGVAAGEH